MYYFTIYLLNLLIISKFKFVLGLHFDILHLFLRDIYDIKQGDMRRLVIYKFIFSISCLFRYATNTGTGTIRQKFCNNLYCYSPFSRNSGGANVSNVTLSIKLHYCLKIVIYETISIFVVDMPINKQIVTSTAAKG